MRITGDNASAARFSKLAAFAYIAYGSHNKYKASIKRMLKNLDERDIPTAMGIIGKTKPNKTAKFLLNWLKTGKW